LQINEDRIGLSYVIGLGPSTSREMVSASALAEKRGFYSVFVPEHYYDRESPSVLGAISQATSKIKIGTGVINPFSRFPSLIAMTAATLDELSNGRAFLGLGSGGVIGSLSHGIPNEFSGLEYSNPLGHLSETVEIIRKLLSQEKVTFHGRFYNLENVKLNFRPIQESIPIYFGQQGPKMMELAGRIADGVLITLCCTIPYVKDVISKIESSLKKINRKKGSFDYAARIITSLSNDSKEALKSSRQVVARVFVHPGAKPVLEASGLDLDIEQIKNCFDSGRTEKLEKLVSDEVVEMSTASGNKREILKKIEEFRQAGVTQPLIVPIGKNYAEVIDAFAK